jgi:hypothetical protein
MNFLMTKTSKPISLSLLSLLTVFAMNIVSSGEACAQEQCITYKTYLETFYREEPVVETKLVNETAYETKTVTKQRRVYTTETRMRKKIVKKPVQTTGERIETETLSRKVEETKYREIQVEEESFEDVTEMRDEEYTVQKTVKETLFREQEETVRVPVTETRMETEDVTTYRPVEVAQQSFLPAQLIIPGAANSQSNARPSIDWLRPGYYTDPTTGQSVYRRRGLHWVMPQQNNSTAVPVVIPQESKSVALVPEILKREKPVQVTRYVDKVETRKVPVEVDRVVDEVRTRKVPVTVRKPVKKMVTKRVPYTSTTYEPVEVTRRVPTVETVQKEVEIEEPYEVTVCKWVPFTETVRVPKTVTKKVDYKTTRKVPYTVTMRVACDEYGNQIGKPERVKGTERIDSNWAKSRPLVSVDESTTRTPITSATRETATRETAATESSNAQSGLKSVLNSDPARFDVPDSNEPQPKPADTVPTIRGEEISTAPPATANIEFPPSNEFTGTAKTELVTIDREKLTAETSARTPKKSDLEMYLEERSRRNLSNAGLNPVTRSKPSVGDESVPTTETKTLDETSVNESSANESQSAVDQEDVQEKDPPIQVDESQFFDAAPPVDTDVDSSNAMDAIERDIEVERDDR